MKHNLLKKAKSSWMNIALTTGSVFSLGTSQAYYRMREAYYSRKPHSIHQTVTNTGLTLNLNRDAFPNFSNFYELAHKEINLVKGQKIKELVIIDGAVPQKDLFYKQAKPHLDIVEINSEEAGLTQLLDILSKYENLDAIHLVSHAKEGTLFLGNQQVKSKHFKNNTNTFTIINKALKPEGDFLLYGCELGKGKEGEDFLQTLKNNTHADIAASDDLTGNQAQEGDWELEIQKGDIEASPINESIAMKDFTGVLQTFSFNAATYVAGSGYFGANGAMGGGDDNAANNPQFNENGYTLEADGTGNTSGWILYSSGSNDFLVNFYGGSPETSLILSFTNGAKFDPTSIDLYNFTGGGNWTFTADTGTSFSVYYALSGIPFIFEQDIDLTSLGTGVSSITITTDASSGLYAAFDDFRVTNLIAPTATFDFTMDEVNNTSASTWSLTSGSHQLNAVGSAGGGSVSFYQANPTGGYLALYAYDEGVWRFSLGGGKAFDLTGLSLLEANGSAPTNFYIKTNQGNSNNYYVAGGGTFNSLGSSSALDNITYFEIISTSNNLMGSGNDHVFNLYTISMENITTIPLPIHLLEFQAQRLGESISLKWSTTSEKDNAGFEIEESIDGANFEKIAFVDGAGNSNSIKRYNHTIRQSKSRYYRLKQIDFDGKFSYSPIRAVTGWESENEPLLYPNPTQGQLFIKNIADDEKLVVDIFDLQGKQLAILQGTKVEVEQKLGKKFEALEKGVYTLRLRTVNRTYDRKVIKE